jgi:hypothetical protein
MIGPARKVDKIYAFLKSEILTPNCSNRAVLKTDPSNYDINLRFLQVD